MEFGIQIDMEESVLSQFTTNENEKLVNLYRWQREAMQYFFDNDCKCILEVATGAGKTFVAISIIKELLKTNPKLNTLIVVPKNVILEQTWFKELYDNDLSMADVGVYYGFTKEYGKKITITNMQNMNNITLELFDFAIFDEIHNYGTVRMLKYLSFPFKYMLGLSATTERSDSNHWQIFELFNYNIFKYSSRNALEDGILNPFNFINIGIKMDDESYDIYCKLTEDLTTIFKLGGGFNKIMRSNNPIKLRMLKKLQERKQLMSNYPLKFNVACSIANKHIKDKIVFFNEYNDQTNELYWHLLDTGVSCRIMHSGINMEKRDEYLRDMKHGRANVLCASKVIDEGWNLPAVDVAVIMAGESSDRQTIQRFGRVLRKKDKISTIYQVYCKGTVEERYAYKRTRMFKELCLEYNELTFKDGDKI